MHEYEVEINGYKTTLQLSDDDAKAMGLTKPVTKAKQPANKAQAPANKARTSASKRADAVSKSFNGKKDNAGA
ncbi:hypothetical protein EB72_24775 [Mycobacterium sp. SWH-M1]|nr:hypothetical protein EB72_24775 [Mycobacterium sp. SWH-M1]